MLNEIFLDVLRFLRYDLFHSCCSQNDLWRGKGSPLFPEIERASCVL
jgi:hypothetical protein